MRVRVTYNIEGGVPENQPPIITDIPAQTNNEEDVISLQVNATDPDGNNLSYSATGLPAGLSINPSTGLISGTITIGAETSSPYTVTVTVQDDGSPVKSTDEIFSWGVSAVAVNQPPVITPISNQSNTEEDVVSLQVNATDPENGVLTYSVSSLPTGLSINSSTGLISGTISVGAEASSPYITTITVTDDGSPIESSQILVTWTVSTVNQAPVITTIPTQNDDEGDVISLQVSATDPEGNNLSYSATGLPAGLSINSSTGLISGTVSVGSQSSSPYTVTVTVTDDGSPIESSNEVFTWNVSVPVTGGPVDTSLYDSSGNQIAGSVVNGDIPNDYYSLGANGASTGVRVEFGTSCNSIGDYAFGGGNYTLDGPIIIGDGVANSITNIGSNAFYYCTALFGPVVIGNTVTSIGDYVFAFNCPLDELYLDVPSTAFTSIGAFDNQFGVGIFDKVIYVSPTYFGVGSNYDTAWRSAQSLSSGSTIVNWDNYPNPIPNNPINQAPILSPIGNQTNEESDVVSLQVSATDPENDNLTYSSTGLPTGLSINSTTGLISGTISVGAEASSPYTTTVTVTDDGSPIESTNEVFTWNVSAVVALTDTIIYDAGDNFLDSIPGPIPANWDRFSPFPATRLEIGTSCTSIGSYAFYQRTGYLSSLDIPSSVVTIGNYAFGSTNFTSPLVLPDSVTSIGIYAFGNCFGIPNTVLELPDNAVTVSSSAFAYLQITDVVAVNTATNLAGASFFGSTVATAYLAPSFSSVNSLPFTYCGNFSTVYAKDAVANGWTLGAGQNILGASNVTVFNWDNYPVATPN
jgi:hypothetical protein